MAYVLYQQVTHLKVVNKLTIYHILPARTTIYLNEYYSFVKGECNLLVFGQKTLRFVTLQPTYESRQLLRYHCVYTLCGSGHAVCRIKHISSSFNLVDWILDVCWLDSVRDGVYRLAAVTAHNAVYIIESIHDGFEMQVVAEYHCEINCILYLPFTSIVYEYCLILL